MASSQARKALIQRRRDVHAKRRFSVEYLGQSRTRETCDTCGWSRETLLQCGPHLKPSATLIPGNTVMPEHGARKLAHYWRKGVNAFCPACTKATRDRLYPLT